MKSLMILISVLIISVNFSALHAQGWNQDQPPVDSSQQIAQQIVSSKIPVLVDFWASWCAPCRMLNPIIKELETEFKGKVLFVKINVDIHKSIASYFEVSSIPVIFIVKDKIVVNALPGLQSKAAYAAALNNVLNSSESPSTAIPSK